MSNSTSNIATLSPEQFCRLPRPPRLLDVRTALEYRASHAPTAVHLSMQRILLGRIPGLRNWVLPQWFRDLPRDEPLAVMCLTSHRSPIVAQALTKAGFSNILNISGGLMDWEKADLPVKKASHEKTRKKAHPNQPEA